MAPGLEVRCTLINESLEIPPQTPPGFKIRTPIDRSVFGLVFENLSVLQFQENIQALSCK